MSETTASAAVIRPAVHADLEAIVTLWAEVFPEYADPARPQRDPRAGALRKLDFDDGLFWVAERAGRVVGTVMAGWDGHRGWLYSLGVHPEARRGGLGRRLAGTATEALQARGCPKVNPKLMEENRAHWPSGAPRAGCRTGCSALAGASQGRSRPVDPEPRDDPRVGGRCRVGPDRLVPRLRSRGLGRHSFIGRLRTRGPGRLDSER